VSAYPSNNGRFARFVQLLYISAYPISTFMIAPNENPSSQTEEAAASATQAPPSMVKQGVAAIIRSALAILGAILIPLGVIIAFLTPILPIGLPIVILGVVLLARNAVWGRRWLQGMLARHPSLERFAPDWLLRLIFGEHKDS
jgi:hypothetical protein